MNYSLNHARLIFDELPKKFRKIRMFQFLVACLSELVNMYNIFLEYIYYSTQTANPSAYYSAGTSGLDFTGYSNVNNYANVNTTGVTIVLQKFLQLYYHDSTIHIVNTSYVINQVYLYNLNLEKYSNIYLYRSSEPQAGTNGTSGTYLYSMNEINTNVDFVVYVPSYLFNNNVLLNQIHQLIDKYKIIGTIYSVVQF